MCLEQIRERILEYCTRYKVTALNEAGFPVFPAGRRETQQHREWIALYQLFNRSRKRSGEAVQDGASNRSEACPVCLRPVRPPGSRHQKCEATVEFIRELGPDSTDRIRAVAFPDQGRSVVGGKRKA